MAFRLKGFERGTETGDHLYWGDEEGWVFKEAATIFTQATNLPPGVMAVEPVEQTEVPSITIAVRGGGYRIEDFVGEATLTVVDYDNFREEVYTSEDDCTEIEWRKE